MVNISYYDSQIGKITIASKNEKIIGLWLEGQKYYKQGLDDKTIINDNDIAIKIAKKWLDDYFLGKVPNIPYEFLAPSGSDFEKNVWKILCTIPYGNTTTYGDIAKNLEKIYNKKMSAQAVGGAVCHNPISIIIPCHRVIGKDGNLTGYAGGIDNKIKLLRLENVDMTHMYIPKINKK